MLATTQKGTRVAAALVAAVAALAFSAMPVHNSHAGRTAARPPVVCGGGGTCS
jgi:hypothetical protein